MLNRAQLQGYFKRIQFQSADNLLPNIELLEKLHEAHVFTIPFENLSIFMGEAVNIDIQSIYRKLVEQERGGYCYEMNGLFYAVLSTLGFDVQIHLSEVAVPDKPWGELEARHAILLVNLDNHTYLVDVGFGKNGLIHPILLSTDQPQYKVSYQHSYQLSFDKHHGFIYSFFYNNDYQREYRFGFPVKKLTLADLEEHNIFAQTKSIFTQLILITKPTPTGRLTLNNNNLRKIKNSLKTEKTLASLEEYFECLAKVFNLKLDLISKLKPPFQFQHLALPFFSETKTTQDTITKEIVYPLKPS